MEDLDISFSVPTLICQEDCSFFYKENEDIDDSYKETEHDHDNEYIQVLFTRECNFRYLTDDSIQFNDSWLKQERSNAIKWIMETRMYFNFSYQTAYLAVTYFDRFLVKRSFDRKKSWAIHLLSIACISLASKMEECIVPMLSEYQYDNKRFCSDTTQKMELLILSTLEWNMNSITPFSYLSSFIYMLGQEYKEEISMSKAVGFIFAILDDVNLVDFRPSIIAAAAVLAAYNERLEKELVESELTIFSSSFKSLNIADLLSCYNLMMEKSQRSMAASCNGDSTFMHTTCNNRKRRKMHTTAE